MQYFAVAQAELDFAYTRSKLQYQEDV